MPYIAGLTTFNDLFDGNNEQDGAALESKSSREGIVRIFRSWEMLLEEILCLSWRGQKFKS